MSKNKAKRREPTNADLKPQTLKIGKWTIKPLTVNTLILLEKIDSPFMDEGFNAATGKYTDGQKLTIEEMIRSFYVIANADDPRIDEQVNDPVAFNRCVSAMAREISMADLARMTAGINEQMGRVNEALADTSDGAEGNAPKKETGPAS